MIRNKTRSSIISEKEKILTTISSMAKGLMFTLRVKRPLVFTFPYEQQLSFHMLFVFHSIDMIFLDRKMQVVEIKEGFRPFTFYRTKNHAQYCIETEKGTIKKTGTRPGDLIEIIHR